MTDKEQIEKDISFLREMKVLTESLINDKYDINKVIQVNEMLSDWHRELLVKLKKL